MGEKSRSSETEESEVLSKLLENLQNSFNLSELKEICFRLGINYEMLSGDTIKNKSLELINYLGRRDQLSELAILCIELRPGQEFWRILARQLDKSNFSRSYQQIGTYKRVDSNLHLLPFMADRDEQEEQLFQLLQFVSTKIEQGNPPRPIICILPGSEKEEHGKYSERLRFDILPRFLHQKYVQGYFIEWSRFSKSDEGMQKRIERRLGEETQDNPRLTQIEINEYFIKLEVPVVIETQVDTEVLTSNGVRKIEVFLEFWRNWPEMTSNQALIILLHVKYRLKRRTKWSILTFSLKRPNKRIAQYLSELSFNIDDLLYGKVLPELSPITQNEAEAWAHSCKKHLDIMFLPSHFIPSIQEFYRDYEQDNGETKIPLEVLAKKLQELLYDITV